MESIVHHRTLKITTIFFYLCFNFKPIFPFPLNSYCSPLFLRVLNKYCFLSYSIWFCMQPLPILHVFALVETVTCHSQELGSRIDLACLFTHMILGKLIVLSLSCSVSLIEKTALQGFCEMFEMKPLVLLLGQGTQRKLGSHRQMILFPYSSARGIFRIQNFMGFKRFVYPIYYVRSLAGYEGTFLNKLVFLKENTFLYRSISLPSLPFHQFRSDSATKWVMRKLIFQYVCILELWVRGWISGK